MLGTTGELDHYRNIRVGDKRRLSSKEGFGSHWRGRLDDIYQILAIFKTSRADITGLDPRTLDYQPELINVKVQSVECPEFEHVIGIQSFL